ncbi:MAG: LD-carboxypeptidase [Burkholderiales bacterium]|nr:LD-carboxypeptidase [Burkholderiales bacterium]MDE1928293.1 LD-carboxypeptidase [Burkholderiales bacterium]MDE2157624.1 LD-carboxypeptidase [Burkholderiales bacterium]MDE2504707.1 LD-carboxypeptidase [Burkholderiales bacterium]
MPIDRRSFFATATLAAAGLPAAAAPPPPRLRARRLQPGDTIALVSPADATFEREPIEIAIESLQALGFKVRQAPHLRARRGPYGGTDAERAGDINAMFADPGVQGILALTGGSGCNRILPLVDYPAIRRNPKFLGGYSDLTALINAVQHRTGLVTFHCPMGASAWNAFSVHWLRAAVVDAQALTLVNGREPEDELVPHRDRTWTLRGGRARGRLVGGNLAVLSSIAGSPYWPDFDGAILCLEEVNEYLYRVDRMLSTLKLAGALDRLAGVALGAFTNCGPGSDGYGSLTLDEIFDDYFGGLGIPVYAGASFGHIQRKFTLPVGLDVEIDADAGTLRYLEPAVLA